MQFINLQRLIDNEEALNREFNSKKPFRYIAIDNFLNPEPADRLLEEFTYPTDGTWNYVTYLNQNKKFTKTQFEEGSIMNDFYKEINGREFLDVISRIVDIEDLMGDDTLFGAGLHQTVAGGFLDVHVDFNMQPHTKFHRRRNAIIYMNKNWKDEYEGHLELWDNEKMELLQKVSPDFNRCVIFETNEISFHGHPKPLNPPKGGSRKSIATYFYTRTRPEEDTVPERNTIFLNTEGLKGKVKNWKSGVQALSERMH